MPAPGEDGCGIACLRSGCGKFGAATVAWSGNRYTKINMGINRRTEFWCLDFCGID